MSIAAWAQTVQELQRGELFALSFATGVLLGALVLRAIDSEYGLLSTFQAFLGLKLQIWESAAFVKEGGVFNG